MDDGTTTAPAAAKRARRHLPHEVVTEILLQLPVTSLLRFRRVCRAWHATIAGDPSFARAHLRLHRHKNGPYILIAPQIEAVDVPNDDDDGSDGQSLEAAAGSVATAGLYQWEEVHSTATLLHPMASLPAEVAHDFAHCDGLVLAPTESAVRVINPATRRILTLPPSLGGVPPRRTPSRSFSHQAFGLGHDPRSDTYKVARFFHRTEHNLVTRNDRYVPRVEVFAIGTNHQYWRETATEPPYAVMARKTATFFEGSLLWTIDQRVQEAPRGFLRFMLDDEIFHVIPPPLFSWFNHETSTLSELHGRLFLTCRGRNDWSVDMWMCTDMDGMPRWERRYTIEWDWSEASLRPVAVLGYGILVCRASGDGLCRCIVKAGQRVHVKDIFSMNNLEYYNPDDATLIQYPWEIKSFFDVIPYVPSLIPI